MGPCPGVTDAPVMPRPVNEIRRDAENAVYAVDLIGAGAQDRTADLLITNQLLYP